MIALAKQGGYVVPSAISWFYYDQGQLVVVVGSKRLEAEHNWSSEHMGFWLNGYVPVVVNRQLEWIKRADVRDTENVDADTCAASTKIYLKNGNTLIAEHANALDSVWAFDCAADYIAEKNK